MPDSGQEPDRDVPPPPPRSDPQQQWLIKSLGDLSSEIRDTRTELKAELDALAKRLVRLERSVDRILVGILIAVALLGFFGWLISPFIEAVADKIVWRPE